MWIDSVQKRPLFASKDKGFTLIEMLVALAIFASLISVLLSGYMQGLSLWERSEKKAATWQKYQSRAAWMRRLSEQIVASEYRMSKGYASFFVGSAVGFKAISSSPIMSPVGFSIPVEFRLVKDQRTGMVRLLYREGKRGEDPGRGMLLQNSDWIVLLDNLERASFSYFALIVNSKSMLLSTSQGWRAKVDQLPQQIALSFVAQDGATHLWRFRCQSHSNAVPLAGAFDEG